MAKIVYPLAQVLDVKKKRVADAEKFVAEKRKALVEEEEKLKEKEKARDEVKKHQDDKLKQMRDELDGGTTSEKIIQMKVYLKVVEERLKVEEKKVQDQIAQVKTAETNLENAIIELNRKRQEVDKLITHREDWLKEVKKEEEIQEGREQDEVGSLTYLARRHKK